MLRRRTVFVESVLTALQRRSMVSSGQTVVVAVSGGPDSTALLHALWTVRSELDIRLVAATMEHGIRGAESAADAEYVTSLCSDLDIECRNEHRDIPAIANRRRVSPSVAARDERHSFLRQVAHEACAPGAERIALGHTSDDRAETILMNILRGAGTGGLCAMPAVQLPIIRPILACTHAQAEDYCADAGLQPRTDSSNTIIDYRRNRVRTELLPHLATYYNSGVRDALIRLAEISQVDLDVLDDLAGSLLIKAAIDCSSHESVLNSSILRAAPPGLQRRAVRLAIENVRGDLTDIGFNVIESILAAVNGARATEQTLPQTAIGHQIHIQASEDTVRIWAATTASERCIQWKVTLSIPGEVDLPFGGRRVVAEVAPARMALERLQGIQSTEREVSTCHFRTSDLSDVVTLRSWRPGDRIHLKGMLGTKKLQDLYTDCKIPRSERNVVPVAEICREPAVIVAALGVRCCNLALNGAELRELAVRASDEQITVLSLMRPA